MMYLSGFECCRKDWENVEIWDEVSIQTQQFNSEMLRIVSLNTALIMTRSSEQSGVCIPVFGKALKTNSDLSSLSAVQHEHHSSFASPCLHGNTWNSS